MKAKTDKPETYPLTKKEFTQFTKALIAVPKSELDKQEIQYQKEQAKKHAKQKR
jgi:hypothetical protein